MSLETRPCGGQRCDGFTRRWSLLGSRLVRFAALRMLTQMWQPEGFMEQYSYYGPEGRKSLVRQTAGSRNT